MTINKKKYALVMVDDYSRYTWVKFLHSKDETAQLIIDHIKRIETESSLKVRVLRSDNGTEFKNSTTNEFCKEKGITHTFSAAGTPQQNGVVERKNRTLIEAARTMLQEAKLPTYFWADAISTACFTQNRTLITKQHGKTPYEIMMGRKPSLKFFHVFGCRCFVFRDQRKLGKFDSKSDEAIFLGYSLNSKAYRVYNLNSNTVMESMHVNFDDNKAAKFKPNEEINYEQLIFENEGKLTESGYESFDDEFEIYNSREVEDQSAANTLTSPAADHSENLSADRTETPPADYIEGLSTDVSSSDEDELPSNSEEVNGNITGGASPADIENEHYHRRGNLPLAIKWSRDHPQEQIMGDPQAGVQTRSATQNECLYLNFR